MRCNKAFALKSYLYKHEESSCMKNQVKLSKSTDKEYNSPIQMYTNESSNVAHQYPSCTSSIGKVLKKVKQSENQKKFKERLKEKLKNPDKVSESIITDVTSQKSYINLTNPSNYDCKNGSEQYSRISVIRSALSVQNNTSDFETTLPSPAAYASGATMGFYKEKPMDYSPKKKFPNNNTLSNFEILTNYAIVA